MAKFFLLNINLNFHYFYVMLEIDGSGKYVEQLTRVVKQCILQ